MVSEGLMGTKLPCTASHEGTGTVVAVGSAIKDIKKGQRVMAGKLAFLPRFIAFGEVFTSLASRFLELLFALEISSHEVS